MQLRLRPWQEASGKVKGVSEQADGAVLSLIVGDIELPGIDSESINKLQRAEGKHIAILRTNIPGKPYAIREA